jgi:protein TonB
MDAPNAALDDVTGDGKADLSSPRRTKLGVAVTVASIQILVFLGLVQAFSPGTITKTVETVVSTFTVTVTTPPPDPPPPKQAPDKAGAAGEVGKKANPREVAAPKSRIPIAKNPAPKAPGSGSANVSGAGNQGSGTGAGGAGSGPGAGAGGTGQGGGVPTKLEKTAGDINSIRDFPRATRDARIGKEVIVELDVGTNGRASACRVVSPSGAPEADAIVCRLAVERFRFNPRTDGMGNPQPGKYRWRQRWWDPRD